MVQRNLPPGMTNIVGIAVTNDQNTRVIFIVIDGTSAVVAEQTARGKNRGLRQSKSAVNTRSGDSMERCEEGSPLKSEKSVRQTPMCVTLFLHEWANWNNVRTQG